jgi:two-component system chemotaxis sensor kinase CheA
MNIDMSPFYQVFFEEAAEHLANMEALLLALDVDAQSSPKFAVNLLRAG